MSVTPLFVLSDSLDPCWNLAREEQFLHELGPEEALLFVYRNRPSVVIGKHQNPWAECWLTKVLTSRVKLVRRISGGGTVFHDEGNLNFSFIVPKEYYSVSRHFEVVQNALRKCGSLAERNARNDLEMEGLKFSGSAFCFRKKAACHHGTLLISSDLERMGCFLKKNDPVIRSKAISSVPSPVRNLASWKHGLTADKVVDGLFEAFGEQAGGDVLRKSVSETDARSSFFQEAYEKYLSWEWNFGRTPEFSLSLDVAAGPLEVTVLEGKVGEILIAGATLYPEMSGCAFFPDTLRKRSETLPDQEKTLFKPVMEALEKNVFGKF